MAMVDFLPAHPHRKHPSRAPRNPFTKISRNSLHINDLRTLKKAPKSCGTGGNFVFCKDIVFPGIPPGSVEEFPTGT